MRARKRLRPGARAVRPPATTDRIFDPDPTFPGELRTDFQRDRDRVLYSPAFRRLAGVTQVVHASEGHLFHNRLTHSLKVGQLARRFAEHLLRKESPDTIRAVGGIHPDVAETAGLAHDLGHPPFGHIAEDELQEKTHKVLDGFEGNPQSFRVVTKLAVRSLEIACKGLNLTRASLNAILKYPWPRGVAGEHERKWGHYFSEQKEFEFARALEAPHSERKSVEAALMDFADDVTYAVHDVEDFYQAGIIPLEQLLTGAAELDRFVARYAPDSTKMDQARRLFIGIGEWSHTTRGPFSGSRTQLAELDIFRSLLIRRYRDALSLTPNDTESPVGIDKELKEEVNILKDLMKAYVFNNPALVAQQHGQRRIVGTLFDILLAAVDRGSKHRGIIPFPFRDLLEDIDNANYVSKDDRRERTRLVIDIIASLTEQQAIDFHNRLTGLSSGSILDTIVR